MATIVRRRNLVLSALGLLTLIMNLIFPKGGIKVEGFPITEGYVLLIFYSAIVASYGLAINSSKLSFRREQLLAVLCVAPFMFYSAWHILAFGVNDFEQSLALGLEISLLLMPIIFIFPISAELNRTNSSKIQALLQIATVLICTFGLVQFFYSYITGRFIEIPYLTLNADDVGLLGEDEKNNARGNFFKLFSTYNNGNLFGVCLLLMLPIAEIGNKRILFVLITRMALFLTLSRSIWVGWIAYEVWSRVLSKKPTYKSLVISGLIGPIIILGIVGLIYNVGTEYLGFNSDFFVDKSLGGRDEGISETELSILSPGPSFFSSEIIYVMITQGFGIMGLILFVPYLFTAVLVKKLRGVTHLNGKVNRAARLAIGVYAIVGMSDGAIQVIPTLAIFWFISALAITPDQRPNGVEIA